VVVLEAVGALEGAELGRGGGVRDDAVGFLVVAVAAVAV